ncbi:MAG TPA: hypothetical protein VEI53_01115, partial [Ktedonobacteraceae bacterium]|nr:hypothetical protein [Ktedonobacteraceae bacterium]
MIRCEYCRMELPEKALYCSNCGHKFGDKYATVTDISNPIEFGSTTQQNFPPFSSQPNTDTQASEITRQDIYATHQMYWSFDESEPGNPQGARQTDEHDYVIPDLLLPGMLAVQSQTPSTPQPPMVQGTPQFGGVPSVQGTPASAGNVAQPVPGSAHAPASSVPSAAPYEAQVNPIYHRQMQQPDYQPILHHQQPVHHQSPVGHQQPVPSDGELGHRHHHSGSLHKHKKHSTKLHHSAATSKAGMSALSKWLIVVVVSLVLIGSSSFLLAHA